MKMADNSEELQFVENVPQDMICSICKSVLHEPHLVNCCEQLFCQDCLEEWLESNPSCPHCRATSFTHMLMKQKSRKIGELKVYCPNRKYGCDAILKYIDCSSHISPTNNDGCPYVTLACPNDCGTEVFRGKIMEHCQTLCSHRIVSCVHCKLEGKYYLMVQHVQKCPMRPVACPLGCGMQVLLSNLQSHKDECSLELVPCTYRELGCKADIHRRDMKKHLKSTDHTNMIVNCYAALKNKYSSLQDSHTTLSVLYMALKDEHETLQAEHHLFKKDHNKLQAEHRQFKKDHEKLQAVCEELQSNFNALTIELVSSKRKETLFGSSAAASDPSDLFTLDCTVLQSKSEAAKETLFRSSKASSPNDLFEDVLDGDSSADTDPLQAAKKVDFQYANTLCDTSKHNIGSGLFLQLKQGSPGYHHIILDEHAKFTLKWELDDLFPDPSEDVTSLQFHLYYDQKDDTPPCTVDVRVESSYGDSGQIATICCGKLQTLLWEDKSTTANASSEPIGDLYLQCNKSGYLKVSFDYHQACGCRCACHRQRHSLI